MFVARSWGPGASGHPLDHLDAVPLKVVWNVIRNYSDFLDFAKGNSRSNMCNDLISMNSVCLIIVSREYCKCQVQRVYYHAVMVTPIKTCILYPLNVPTTTWSRALVGSAVAVQVYLVTGTGWISCSSPSVPGHGHWLDQL